MRATSNRKLAEALGVSETAVRKALAAGRINRDPDGGFDIPRVKRQWAGNTDAAQAQLRSSDHLGQPPRGPAS
jgi:biotin operon repressor